MALLDIRELDESDFVVHFGGPFNEIEASTLGNSLLALQSLASEINKYVNPGYDVELFVEQTSGGSFRAKLKVTYKNLHNLFSDPIIMPILVGLLTNYVYDRILAPTSDPIIIVNTDEVVVDYGKTKLIIPRTVYDKKKLIENDKEIEAHVNKFVQSLIDDPDIQAVAIIGKIDKSGDIAEIPRTILAEYAARIRSPDDDVVRYISDRVVVTVYKAILGRTSRKWEFIWNGVRISARIKDDEFFDKLQMREITFASGDSFDVMLRIKQIRSIDDDVWINQEYEIIKVFDKIDYI